MPQFLIERFDIGLSALGCCSSRLQKGGSQRCPERGCRELRLGQCSVEQGTSSLLRFLGGVILIVPNVSRDCTILHSLSDPDDSYPTIYDKCQLSSFYGY